MRKLIGVIAVALLVVAFSVPVSATAVSPVICSQETAISQPANPYRMQWHGFQRRVVAEYSAAATFTGTCRGFLTGKVTVSVQSPTGKVRRYSKTYNDLEFKDGFVGETRYRDHGRFADSFVLKSNGPIAAGTCISVTVRWRPWRYNDNELVRGNVGKRLSSRGCYRSR